MAHNSIAGWVWLGLVFGGLGYGATQGLTAGKKAQEDIAKKQEEARVVQLNADMSKAIYEARKQNFQEAIRLLSELADANPDRAAVHLNLGIAQRAVKNYDAATVALERAGQLNPDDWDVVAELATISAERGKLEEGIKKAMPIPTRMGHMMERLRADPAWADQELTDDLRVLRVKHGLDDKGVAETGVRGHQEMERQRKSYPEAQQAPDEHEGHEH